MWWLTKSCLVHNDAKMFFSTSTLQKQAPWLTFSTLFKTSTANFASLSIVPILQLCLDVTQIFTCTMFCLKCCTEFRGHERKSFLYNRGPKMLYWEKCSCYEIWVLKTKRHCCTGSVLQDMPSVFSHCLLWARHSSMHLNGDRNM